MKSFIKFFVLLLFTFTVVIACKPEAQITTEHEEQDDLTLLNNVTCMFSDEEIAKLSETISDLDNYYFSTGNYTCQFLTTIDTQETKIIDSCILFSKTARSPYDGSYGGTLSKSSHNTVVIASSKSSKNEYDPDVLETVLWDSNGMHWDGWKGLIGSYSDANPHALYGKTVADLFEHGMLITQGATTIQTNKKHDKFYIHKTIDGNDIQICLLRETTNDDYFDYSDFEFDFIQTTPKTYKYKTIDQNCNEITCSSYYEYEAGNGEDGTEFELIIVDCHGTLMDNASCPSIKGASFGIDMVQSKKAIIIAPDYIGYGITYGKTHPYCIANLNARNIIDSILSIKLKSGLKFSADCKTLIMGYSQGGQTSLATYRFIQESIPKGYKTELNVSKVYAGAGPYDLVATMDTFLSSNTVIAPFIYLVVKGYLSMGYSSLKNYKLEDFFTASFLESEMKKSLDELNYSFSLGGVTIPDGLIETFQTGGMPAIMSNPEYLQFVTNNPDLVKKFMEFNTYSDITKLATPEFLNSSSSLSKVFKKTLQLNNLTTGWTPVVPVYIYHLQDDDVVPFINYEKLQEGMNNCSNIEFYKSTETITTSGPFDFKHGKAARPFYEAIVLEINEGF